MRRATQSGAWPSSLSCQPLTTGRSCPSQGTLLTVLARFMSLTGGFTRWINSIFIECWPGTRCWLLIIDHWSVLKGVDRWSGVWVTVCCWLSGLWGYPNKLQCHWIQKHRKFDVLFVSCSMSIVQTGKWRKPTGVLVDQVGHLLVVDQVQLSP